MGSLAGAPTDIPATANGQGHKQHDQKKCVSYFQVPLHYPRYTKADYEKMPEWKLNCLLNEYGLPVVGDLEYKRNYAMGAFLWSDQY